MERLKRYQRRDSLHVLLNTLETHRLNSSEQAQLLERIMREALTGIMAPHEVRTLTKAVMREQEKHAS